MLRAPMSINAVESIAPKLMAALRTDFLCVKLFIHRTTSYRMADIASYKLPASQLERFSIGSLTPM